MISNLSPPPPDFLSALLFKSCATLSTFAEASSSNGALNKLPHLFSFSHPNFSPPLQRPQSSLSPFSTAMKFIKAINPKNLLQSKKSGNRRISKSEPVSFNTVSSSSSSSSSYSETFYADSFKTRRSTPTSVLQPPERSRSQEIAPRTPVNGDGDVWFELVEAFKLIDRDGDGKITICELQTILSRIVAVPESEEELHIMLTEIDLDGDGFISLEEFGAIRSAFGPASGAEELRETFEVFDSDHDGRITAEELLSVFSAIGDEKCTLEDCRRMIASVDVNGDGFVCFEEFKMMMEQQRISC